MPSLLSPEAPNVYASWSIDGALRPRGDRVPLAGIGLVTVDVENLLAPYGGDRPYDDSSVLGLGKGLCARGVNVCLLSNATDAKRVAKVADELQLPYVHKGLELPDGTVVPSKMHPEAYQAAVDLVGFGPNGSRGAHMDDQLKNVRGMAALRDADGTPIFSTYFWVFPRGWRSHPGTLAARPLEFLAVGAAVAATRVRHRSG